MKRYLIFFILIIVIFPAYAKSPKLNVESLFDGRYNNSKNVTISIYKNNANYYRGITVKDNSRILKSIVNAIEKDKPRSEDYYEYQDESGRYISLKITNNGEIIYIGLQCYKSDSAFFFIQGKEKAFE